MFIEDLYLNLKNVIRWLPIIWNDRQWDHGYLTNIIIFKLKLMQKYFINSTNIMEKEQEKIVKSITEVRTLLIKLQNDPYFDMVLTPEEHKIFDSHWDFVLGDKVIEGEDDYTIIDWRKRHKEADALEKADIKRLSALLKKHYRTWWN